MKFPFLKRKPKNNREFAMVSYYEYCGAEVGWNIRIKSDVQISEEQLSKIYDAIRKSDLSDLNWVARDVLYGVGKPVSRVDIETDVKNHVMHIKLREWPYD